MGLGSCWLLPVIYRWNFLSVCHSKDKSAKVYQFHSTHPQASSLEMIVSSCLRHILTLSVFFDSFGKFYRHIPRSVCHKPLTFSALEMANKIQAKPLFPRALNSWKHEFLVFYFQKSVWIFQRKEAAFLLTYYFLPAHLPAGKSCQPSSDWQSHCSPVTSQHTAGWTQVLLNTLGPVLLNRCGLSVCWSSL